MKNKKNERKERGKGEEKGNGATPARGELQSTKLCPMGLTSECGYWNCTNAQKLYNIMLKTNCSHHVISDTTRQLQYSYMQVSHKTVNPSCWQYTCL